MVDVEALRAEAEALGIKVDGRWGADRLSAEVSAARPAAEPDEDLEDDDEPDDEQPDDDAGHGDTWIEPVDELEQPRPFRAGGHVNHGDGRGWVLEPEDET